MSYQAESEQPTDNDSYIETLKTVSIERLNEIRTIQVIRGDTLWGLAVKKSTQVDMNTLEYTKLIHIKTVRIKLRLVTTCVPRPKCLDTESIQLE